MTPRTEGNIYVSQDDEQRGAVRSESNRSVCFYLATSLQLLIAEHIT